MISRIRRKYKLKRNCPLFFSYIALCYNVLRKERENMFQILVVDDDKNTRRLMEAVLKAENFAVFTAENGEKALDLMER